VRRLIRNAYLLIFVVSASWTPRIQRKTTLTGLSSRQCARFTGITVCFYTRDIGYGAGRRATEEEAVAAARKTRLRQLAILPTAVAPVAPAAYAPIPLSPSRISRRESRQVPGLRPIDGGRNPLPSPRPPAKLNSCPDLVSVHDAAPTPPGEARHSGRRLEPAHDAIRNVDEAPGHGVHFHFECPLFINHVRCTDRKLTTHRGPPRICTHCDHKTALRWSDPLTLGNIWHIISHNLKTVQDRI